MHTNTKTDTVLAGNVLIGIAIGFSVAILVGTGLWCWTRRRRARDLRRLHIRRHGSKIDKIRALEEGRHPRLWRTRSSNSSKRNVNRKTYTEKIEITKTKLRPPPPPIPELKITVTPPSASTGLTKSYTAPRAAPRPPSRPRSSVLTAAFTGTGAPDSPGELQATPIDPPTSADHDANIASPILPRPPAPPLQIKTVRGAHRITLGPLSLNRAFRFPALGTPRFPKSARAIFHNLRTPAPPRSTSGSSHVLRTPQSDGTSSTLTWNGTPARSSRSRSAARRGRGSRSFRPVTLTVKIPQTPFSVPLPTGLRRTPGTAPLERPRSTAATALASGAAAAPLSAPLEMRERDREPLLARRASGDGYRDAPEDSDSDASSIATSTSSSSTLGGESTILSTTRSSQARTSAGRTSNGRISRVPLHAGAGYESPTRPLPPLPAHVLAQLAKMPADLEAEVERRRGGGESREGESNEVKSKVGSREAGRRRKAVVVQDPFAGDEETDPDLVLVPPRRVKADADADAESIHSRSFLEV